jgi:hypothetical protein
MGVRRAAVTSGRTGLAGSRTAHSPAGQPEEDWIMTAPKTLARIAGSLYLVMAASAGAFDAVGSHTDRQAAVWFLMTGAALLLFGYLTRWTQRQTGTPLSHSHASRWDSG